MNTEQIYLDSINNCFSDYKKRGDKTFAQLDDAEMHFRPNGESNSIAIIIQHLHGNMLSRYTNFLTEDGEKEWRRRDDEFEVHPLSKEQLLQFWEEGWKTLQEALSSLTPADLTKTITILHEPYIVIDALNRQLVHCSNHIGQIVYIGKWIKAADWKTLSIPKKGSDDYNKKMMS
jgi:hypothetical protein